MSKLFRDSSVLNQFGSPSINSNTFANRPAFGQPGRLFVSTDTLAIFRDTGSAWDNLTDNPGNIGTLQEVTTNGNSSTNNLIITARENIFTKTFNSSDVGGDATDILNIGSNITLDNSVLGLWNIYSNSYKTIAQNVTYEADSRIDNIFIQNDISNITLSSKTINVNQGSYINTVSAFRILNSFNSSAPLNLSHYASIIIEPVILANSTITNYYGLLINNSTGSTITNRWGIYQNGVNDYNYFSSKVSIGTTTFDSNVLKVNGSATIDVGYIGQVTGYGDSFVSFSHNGRSGPGDYSFLSENFGQTIINAKTSNPINFRINNVTKVTLSPEGNFLVGTETNTTRKLVVAGEQEWNSITLGTGSHTTSGNYLPIWVNGVQYYLDLLN